MDLVSFLVCTHMVMKSSKDSCNLPYCVAFGPASPSPQNKQNRKPPKEDSHSFIAQILLDCLHVSFIGHLFSDN